MAWWLQGDLQPFAHFMHVLMHCALFIRIFQKLMHSVLKR